MQPGRQPFIPGARKPDGVATATGSWDSRGRLGRFGSVMPVPRYFEPFQSDVGDVLGTLSQEAANNFPVGLQIAVPFQFNKGARDADSRVPGCES